MMRKLRHRVRHIIWVNLFLKAGCPNNYSAQAVSGAEQCRLDRSLHAPICQAQFHGLEKVFSSHCAASHGMVCLPVHRHGIYITSERAASTSIRHSDNITPVLLLLRALASPHGLMAESCAKPQPNKRRQSGGS